LPLYGKLLDEGVDVGVVIIVLQARRGAQGDGGQQKGMGIMSFFML